MSPNKRPQPLPISYSSPSHPQSPVTSIGYNPLSVVYSSILTSHSFFTLAATVIDVLAWKGKNAGTTGRKNENEIRAETEITHVD